MKREKKWLVVFFTLIMGGLLTAAVLVVVVDPFFQYHKPLKEFPYVLENQLTQNPGIAKSLDYDSVILGSSMTVTFNTQWFEELLGLNTVKLTYNAAHARDQSNILKVIERDHGDVERVFLCIDPLPYADSVDSVAYPIQDAYYDANYLNDVEYWWNMDVLLNYVIHPGAVKKEADDFNTIYDKYYYDYLYDKDHVLEGFRPSERADVLTAEDTYLENVRLNMETHILPYIENHPETEFDIFFAPYSILFWYNTLQEQNTDARLAEYDEMMELLFAYDNVRVFFFANNQEIICDLDNYIDYTHSSREVHHYMTSCFATGEEEVTKETYRDEIEELRRLVNEFDFSIYGLQ